MPILEGRAVLFALRHAMRSAACRGTRLVVLGDSLTAVCAVSKGRSDSRDMLAITQSIAALLLATGSSLLCRWLPSEFNIADNPSRGVPKPSPLKPLECKEKTKGRGRGDAAEEAVRQLPRDWCGFEQQARREPAGGGPSALEPAFLAASPCPRPRACTAAQAGGAAGGSGWGRPEASWRRRWGRCGGAPSQLARCAFTC